MLVPGDAFIDTKVMWFGAKHSDGVDTFFRFGSPDSTALCEQFIVPVPGDHGGGVAYDMDLQGTLVTHIVCLVVNLLLENWWESCWGNIDTLSSLGVKMLSSFQ